MSTTDDRHATAVAKLEAAAALLAGGLLGEDELDITRCAEWALTLLDRGLAELEMVRQ